MSPTMSSIWLALIGSLFALRASAQNFEIADYIVSGTGCVPGSVNATISSSGQNVNVNYSGFTAKAGPAYGYDDNRKNCQLTLVVSSPKGWQFGLEKFSHDGKYALDSGVTATYKSSYYFQGSISESKGSEKVAGPAKEVGSFSGLLSPVTWSPCGKTSLVGINTDVRVENSGNANGSGYFTLANSPAVNFVWREC